LTLEKVVGAKNLWKKQVKWFVKRLEAD